MKKINWPVVLAGGLVGLAAVVLTALGNPANMGFCIACFLRDIAGATKMHSAAVVSTSVPRSWVWFWAHSSWPLLPRSTVQRPVLLPLPVLFWVLSS